MAAKATRKKVKPQYQKYWQCTVPDGYDIHHIDLNPENNDPENLVALPRELHQEYHKALFEFNRWGGKGTIQQTTLSLNPSGVSVAVNLAEAYLSLQKAIQSCEWYVYVRNNKKNTIL